MRFQWLNCLENMDADNPKKPLISARYNAYVTPIM